jgi:hypothetical protein
MADQTHKPKAKTVKPLEEALGIALKKVLNSHGYPFHESVIRVISKVRTRSLWVPWVPEFPVQVNGQHTRIDLVLTNQKNNIYLVCECKRSNPAVANWCFAKSCFFPNASLAQHCYMDALQRQPHEGGLISSYVRQLTTSDRLFQVAVEVRGGVTGDDSVKGRGQIEEAATQVCRGLNGLIDSLYQRGLPRLGAGNIFFLPVVITTSKLWATDTDISLTSTETGEIEDASVSVNPMKWLWYQYPQSPGLKHSAPNNFCSHDLREILYHEFVRPIAIARPDGLDELLSASMWEMF